jgi:hypothetical protein
MRLKIFALFSAIVLGVGAAISVLVAMHFGDSRRSTAELQASAERAVQLARLQWQADELQRERWLAAHAGEPWVRAVFSLGTGQARGEAATAAANRLLDVHLAAPGRPARPTLSLFIDRDGVSVGRNAVALMRGDPISERHPEQWRVVQSGMPASDVWFNPARQEQWFVSMVPVNGAGGEWLGAVALGVPLNDEALARVSQLTLGFDLWAVSVDSTSVQLLSRSRPTFQLPSDAAMSEWLRAMDSQSADDPPRTRVLEERAAFAAARWVPRDAGLVLIAAASAPAPNAPDRLLWTVWGVIFAGLVLVGAGSLLMAAYYSRPIAELEEGLLQVVNGDRDLRFDVDHPELGGVAARVNLLLDTLSGGHPEAAATEPVAESLGDDAPGGRPDDAVEPRPEPG